MKKIIILTVAALALASCGNRNQQKRTVNETTASERTATASDTHNSRNSLDFTGTYEGTIPCADCSGIKLEIVLNKDETYTKKMTYEGKEPNNVFTTTGMYSWNSSGSIITLNGENEKDMYKVGERRLTMLDQSGNAITGDLADKYILKKK